MTKYTIDFDAKLDAGIAAAHQANDPDISVGEYLAIVLTPYLTSFCKDQEVTAIDRGVAEQKAVASRKYDGVTDSVSAGRQAAHEAAEKAKEEKARAERVRVR